MTQHHKELRVELVAWLEAEPASRAIRETVFIREQAVPEELEWDGLDPLLGMRSLGMTSVTPSARRACKRKEPSSGWRCSRPGAVGRALLQTLLDLAVKQGLSRVTLAAQTHALGFYE